MALLFALSLVGQGALTTATATKMLDGVSSSGAASADNSMDCDGHDPAMQTTCVATCAGIVAIAPETVTLPLLPVKSCPERRSVASLSDRSIAPDPYPPRPSALS
ncbi:MAG: hypothetical protein QOF19_3378 [Alphaproteobacteria bacterium]|jgi:hypothetical protein|nr:hypothetical protein [Alphaproteobacteria bacterium]